MDLKELSKIENLHHAYLVTGSAEGTRQAVLQVLKKRKIDTAGNPDILSMSFPEFNVDSAREVSSYASLNPIGDSKYIIVSFSRATTEAQNALLKVVEEAPGNTVFFFGVESAGHVLPTLKSRCVEVALEGGAKNEEEMEEALEFVKATYEKRLSIVEKMTAAISKTQDRSPARAFIRGLLSVLHEKSAPVRSLRDLLEADRYMRMQGSSAKSVLSHLAVTLPRKDLI